MYLNIRFPNLGITLPSFGTGITIGGFTIKYYGILIAAGFLLGLLAAQREARRTGQNPDDYMDYLLIMVLPSIIGARLYYVLFSWDYYGSHPGQILAIRNGGMAIYGGVLGAAVALAIAAKVKKQSFWLVCDTICTGLLLGQIIGRFGNFINREAFGSYTDSLFAMQIPIGEASYTTAELLEKAVTVDHVAYIQVHPTFLYEAMWNVMVLIVILVYRRWKRFDGELIALYLVGYGTGRALIEGLRTDQLQIGSTGIAVSQVLSIVLAVTSLLVIVCKRNHLKKKTGKDDNPEQQEVSE